MKINQQLIKIIIIEGNFIFNLILIEWNQRSFTKQNRNNTD